MEFLAFDAPKRSLSLRKAAVPKPGPDEVLIRVAYAGVCGTDLHILDGKFPCKENEPLTMGHEVAGTVEAVGSGVRTLKVGQRVVVDPNSGCNACSDCRNARYHLCVRGGLNNLIGIIRNGGWSTHCVIPESQVHSVPDGIELCEAALVEPLSCLIHGWERIGEMKVGDRVLILGAGIIGVLSSCLLHLQGFRRTVTVSEPNEKRRDIIRRLGFDYEVVHPGEIKDREFDICIDCSGSAAAMEAAIPLLSRGGRFLIFGVSDPDAKVSFQPFEMFKKELTICGTHLNPFAVPKGIAMVQSLAESFYLDFDKLGIKVYPLSRYNEAFDNLKKGHISKAMFKL